MLKIWFAAHGSAFGGVKPKITFHHTGVTSSSLDEANKFHAKHELFEEGFNLINSGSVLAFSLAIYASSIYI